MLQIIDILSDDVIGYIFSYLPLLDVSQLGQCNVYLSQFLTDSSPIWQSHLSHYITNEQQRQQVVSQSNNSYKQAVREEALLKFDLKPLNPVFIGPNKCTFSNNNRTVTSSARSNWVGIKTTKKIQDNVLYAWLVELERYNNDSNGFRVFIGLDNDKFPYHDQNSYGDIIGYFKSTGYSYNLGSRSIHSKSQQVGSGHSTEFKDGDVIQCVVDTRYPRSLQSADFTLYKIKAGTAIEVCEFKGIDLIEDGPFYPAVSVIQDRKVTLKPCSTVIWPKKRQ
jgi:hypothetical protein